MMRYKTSSCRMQAGLLLNFKPIAMAVMSAGNRAFGRTKHKSNTFGSMNGN